jgi:NAD kinase
VLRRCVLVERTTEYAELLARHGTREQARFFLEQRGLRIEDVERRHTATEAARRLVLGAIPAEWRRANVERAELDRFLFEPEDVIVVLGQDGLVANAAKYLDGQPVIGLNPDAERNPGVLVPHPPQAVTDLIRDVERGRQQVEARTMARARLDDGQVLHALNELFIGHRTHQSARYALSFRGATERQSSSGVIVTTGTGATGWAASIVNGRARPLELPGPTDPRLAFFVREAWPSPGTGTGITEGAFAPPDEVTIACELGEGGVVFADGIEADRLEPQWGQSVTVTVADRRLMLVR